MTEELEKSTLGTQLEHVGKAQTSTSRKLLVADKSIQKFQPNFLGKSRNDKK